MFDSHNRSIPSTQGHYDLLTAIISSNETLSVRCRVAELEGKKDEI